MAPRLSVVVPIYNVEEYLPACLDSLEAQTLREIEVLMVDDGSPDGSAAIAAEYAARDSRFKLIRKENGGLGAARNTGIGRMSPVSEFLAFVDSDDVIPPDAYRLMVTSLDESGSDFCTGNVFHLRGEKSWQVPLFKMLSGEAQQRTHISEMPKLVADRIACNKVFRRTFWEKYGFSFPEGILHEDIPVVLPAHYRAEAIDIIGEPTYFWRLREGEAAPSITQRRKEPQAIRDRVAAVSMVSEFLAAQPGPEFAEYKRKYDNRVLRDDLRLFLRVLPEADAEFHAAFLEATNRYLDTIDQKIVMALPISLRVQWLLVRKHQMAELIALLASQRRKDPIEVTGTFRKYAGFAPLEAAGIELPKAALRIDKDLALKAPLRSVEWHDGKLVLSGDAWIDKVDMASKRSSVKVVQLKHGKSGRRIFAPAKNVHRPETTTDSGQKRYNYDWAGWELTVDPAKLRKGGAWQEGIWHVGINVYASGLVRRSGVWARGGSAANFPMYHWLDNDHRLLPVVERSALKLRLEKVKAVITDRRVEDDHLVVIGELRAGAPSAENLTLRLSNSKSGEAMEYPADVQITSAGRVFTARVPLAEVALVPNPALEGKAQPRRRMWSTVLVATDADGTEHRYSSVMRDGLVDLRQDLPASMGPDAAHHEIAMISGNNGYLKVVGRARRAVLTAIAERGGKLVLNGYSSERLIGAELLVKARGRYDERTVPVEWQSDGRFAVAFDPSSLGGAGNVSLKAGRWNIFLRLPDQDEVPKAAFVIERLAAKSFPLHTVIAGRRYWFENRWGDFPQLNCRSELNDMERGPYRQLQLRREVYEPSRQLPLKDQVFFFSYNGKQYSDSPRAMHEELLSRGSDLKYLWAVRDGQVVLPPSADKVRMWGREWFEALATSRYIVTNGHLPEWVERRPGQVIVQTWHGTMLKKIGHDIETLHFDREYQARLALEANNWSLLVSSNRFSTPILKRAFSYDGEILEAGYPRNDYLYSPDRDKITESVKTKLGLPPEKKVVLYAPTWRDDRSHSAGQYRFDMKINLEDAKARLGHDHVLLVRRHSNIVDAVPGAGNGFVYDVSEYPDIAELYLAADIMITDYSSVMFDYAHLKRPMLFFTYDLEHYRDTLRGFYFDFEEDSPGPLIRTSEELIESIRRIEEVKVEYQARFDRFHHLFCDLDDGSASKRVVDRMLEQARQG